MNSRDFYRILEGWDVENYATVGVRHGSIYIKNTQSFNDELLMWYDDGTKRMVQGEYLFTDAGLARQWVSDKVSAEIKDLLEQLNMAQESYRKQIAKLNKLYDNLVFEAEPTN